jgi:hypothetical protein
MPSDIKPSSDTDYPYRGVPLAPTIIVQLTKELFAGKLVTRSDIADRLPKEHLKRGGLPPKRSNVRSSIDEALRILQKTGLVENVSRGYWKVLPTNTEVTTEVPQTPDNLVQQAPVTGQSAETVADVVIGEGPASVYLYYLPTYRTRAQERGEKRWPCKIGRTDQNPLQRVLSQAATALPEKPIVAVAFRTKYSAALETAFHSIFTLRGLAVQDAPGTEWFLTSPEEAIALAKVIDPSSFDKTKRV